MGKLIPFPVRRREARALPFGALGELDQAERLQSRAVAGFVATALLITLLLQLLSH